MELKGLLKAPDRQEEAPDDAVKFDALLPAGGSRPRPRTDLSFWGRMLIEASTRLAAHWDSGRVERAALAHALRWSGSSELARQVDVAFDYYFGWLAEVSELYGNQASAMVATVGEMAAIQSFELLRGSLADLLEELRSRVQFLQARAADIRISGKLDEVAKALLDLERDRVVDAIVGVLSKQIGFPDRLAADLAADLARVDVDHPELAAASEGDLRRLGKEVQKRATSRGLDLKVWRQGPGADALRALGIGIASNMAYGWLVHVLS